MAENKIGVAFLGSGFAKNVQAPAFAMLDNVKLIGASSPNNAGDFAQKFNMPVATDNWQELIDNEEVGLVCITSPPLLHCEQAIYALVAGKHVLCEKPFAMNVKEAEKMALAVKGRNQLAVIDHELRFSPARKWLRNALQNGIVGKIYFATAEFHNISRRDTSRPYSWWFDKEWGGGAWGAIGSHLIDQLQYLVDDIAEIDPKLYTSIPERKDKKGISHTVTSDDTASAAIRFNNGAVGSIFSSFVSYKNSLDIEITGELGSIKIDSQDTIHFAEPGQPYKELKPELKPEDKKLMQLHDESEIVDRSVFSRSFIHFADVIVKTLLKGECTIDGAVTFEEGVRIQELMDSHKKLELFS